MYKSGVATHKDSCCCFGFSFFSWSSVQAAKSLVPKLLVLVPVISVLGGWLLWLGFLIKVTSQSALACSRRLTPLTTLVKTCLLQTRQWNERLVTTDNWLPLSLYILYIFIDYFCVIAPPTTCSVQKAFCLFRSKRSVILLPTQEKFVVISSHRVTVNSRRLGPDGAFCVFAFYSGVSFSASSRIARFWE